MRILLSKEEKILEKLIDKYDGNSDFFVNWIFTEEDKKLGISNEDLSHLYYKGYFQYQPTLTFDGFSIRLSKEAIDYFKVKEIKLARFLGLERTDIKVLQYLNKNLNCQTDEIYFNISDISDTLKLSENILYYSFKNLEQKRYIKRLFEPELSGDYGFIVYKERLEDKILEFESDVLDNDYTHINIVNSNVNVGTNNNIVQNDIDVEKVKEEILSWVEMVNDNLRVKYDSDVSDDISKILKNVKEVVEDNAVKTRQELDDIKGLVSKRRNIFLTIFKGASGLVDIIGVVQTLPTIYYMLSPLFIK